MNTTFQEVYDNLKSKIITYEFLNLSIEQENELLEQKLKSALAKFVEAKGIEIDTNTKTFNKELDLLEIEILTYGLLVEWLSPRIYNVELLEQRLQSNEFKQYSQANHLSEMINLKKEAMSDFIYYIKRYDFKKSSKRVDI